MASRMPTRCYVHIAPQAQLSYWVWDQFPLSLCNPSSATAVLLFFPCRLRHISLSLLFPSLLSLLLLLSSLRSFSFVVSLTFSLSRSFLLSPPYSQVRSTFFLSLFLFLFPFCSCSSLLPIVDRLPA